MHDVHSVFTASIRQAANFALLAVDRGKIHCMDIDVSVSTYIHVQKEKALQDGSTCDEYYIKECELE